MRWRRVTVAVILAGCAGLGLFVWSLSRESEREELLRQAKQGQVADIGRLRAAVEAHPDDVELLSALVQCELGAGRLPEAEAALGRWCALRPDDAEPFLTRIDLNFQFRRLPPVIADAQHILELHPDNDALRERLAQWLSLAGRSEEADVECRRCLQRRPGVPALMELQAEIAHRLGDNARAEALADSLLRLDPPRPGALILRGALYLDAGQPERAIPLLRQALALDRGQQQAARHYLGLALARAGKQEEARRVLAEVQHQQALDLWEKYGKPDTVGYKVRIADSLLRTGKDADAVRLLEQALAQAPDCAEAHRLLADYYEKNGQPGRAADHRRRAGP